MLIRGVQGDVAATVAATVAVNVAAIDVAAIVVESVRYNKRQYCLLCGYCSSLMLVAVSLRGQMLNPVAAAGRTLPMTCGGRSAIIKYV